ncbi:MAG: formate/nitrite transporter family protein [Lachnospiraceae bacterium]
MYEEEFYAVTVTAKKKADLLNKNPMGYILSAILGGVFIGFGVLLVGTIAGLLKGQPYMKIVIGAAFGIALSLIVMAGAELFTGNSMIMSMGALGRTVTWKQTYKIWLVCYIGNWIGAILLAVLFVGGGLATGAAGEAMAATAAMKMSIPPLALFIRGILCNVLVCLAVWCTFRCKSESGKLIMIFWCLFAFNICGFEHSIANMTYLTVALMAPFQEAISVGGYFYNILIVTLGNMVGAALFVVVPYYVIGKK